MPDATLNPIRIVLVEPAGARNVGSIARVMMNFGLSRLVLVNPHCDPLSDEARQMAVHAGEILETAQRVETLPEALVGCQRAIATTGRDRALETDLETPEAGLPWLLELAPLEAALIFGPEDRGLSNDELKYAQRFVRIPSDPAYPSLNLAQAVGVCSYELYRAVPRSQETSFSSTQETATIEALEGYYQQLESLLLKIGYLYPHTADSRMEKFRRLFNRAEPSAAEVAMLRGVLRQMDWALGANREMDGSSSPDPSHDGTMG